MHNVAALLMLDGVGIGKGLPGRAPEKPLEERWNRNGGGGRTI